MTGLGKVYWLLGIEIIQDTSNRCITIPQKQYIMKILQQFSMEDYHPVSTPQEPGHQLRKSNPEDKNVDKFYYQQIIRSLMYAMIATRPDIAYAVSFISQFSSDPSETHLKSAKHVLRYSKGTINFSITYKNPSWIF
jgi:hypothetical protein